MTNTVALSRVDSIIHDLYEGILDDVAWGRAILGIADHVGGAAAFLFALNPVTGEVLRDENHRGDPAVLDAYRRHWSYHDPRLPRASVIPVGQPMTERTLLSHHEWRRSAILNDFLIPADVPHFMPVTLHRSVDRFVVLSVQGTTKRGPFHRQNMTDLARLAPHLTRAVTIKDKFQAAQFGLSMLDGCLNARLPYGVLLLDQDLCVLEANDFAARLLRENQGIAVDYSKRLLLPEPAAREVRAAARAVRKRGPLSAGMVRIPRSPAQRPLSLLVTTLGIQSVPWISPTPRCAVLIFDPERSIRIDVDLLRIDLGITRREAEIASLLAMDLDLADAAKKRSITIHTARNQLKSIFAKTGLGSQAELVKKIITGPAASAHWDTGPSLIHEN
jgi:DNA-binding CsgD family transcriptional regulator